MSTSQMIVLLLFIAAWTVSCFPSKPLNERSTQLTWQAWLLIDESQNKQDNTLRRRITPKSVFIAPTFSPETLPECSEGYQSDSMGRCIKIIMLNKELHLDFLLQQLNQKFGGMEDYEDEDETTSGPVNINIPLNAEINEETEVAIVVAPTNNILQSEIKLNQTLSEEKMNAEDIAGILGVKRITEVESTTITSTPEIEETTLESTTRQIETTTVDDAVSKLNALFFLDPKRQVEIKTESYDTTTTLTTETETTEAVKTETTVILGFNTETPLFQMDQALPELETAVTFTDTKREAVNPNAQTTTDISSTETVPNTQSSEKSIGKIDQLQTPTLAPVILTPIDNTLSNHDVLTTQSSETTTKSIFSIGIKKPDFQTLYTNNNLKFLTQFGDSSNTTKTNNTKKNSESIDDAVATTVDEGVITTTDAEVLIETPKTINISVNANNSEPITFPKYAPQPRPLDESIVKQLETARQFQALFSKYVHTRGADLTGNQKHVFKTDRVDPSQNLYQRYRQHRENHRNREKHSEWFHLPPKWTDTSQKPVVLRFSRKQGYIDSQQLGSNNFYREINPRLFGFPAKSSTSR